MKRKIIFSLLSFFFIFSLAIFVQSETASCAPKKTKLNVKKLKLSKGNSYTLRVYNLKKKQTIQFISDDTSIVTVAEHGRRAKKVTITAVGIGNSTIRANIYSRKGKLVRSLKTRVHVTPYAISIKFATKKVKLNVDDTLKLPVIIKPNTSEEIPIFETSDADIVTVNSRGIITGVAPGQATITATLLSSGQKVQCQIQVFADSEDETSSFELNRLTEE